MPCYEFECDDPKCGHKFEKIYLPRISDEMVITDDPEQQTCEKCDDHASLLWSLTVNRPDSFWSGIYMSAVGEYFTSESKYKDHLKRNDLEVIGDRTDREGLAKQATQGMKEKDIKSAKQLDKFLIEETKNEEWGPTGTVKERRKKEQKLREAESANPQDVAIDPAFL